MLLQVMESFVKTSSSFVNSRARGTCSSDRNETSLDCARWARSQQCRLTACQWSEVQILLEEVDLDCGRLLLDDIHDEISQGFEVTFRLDDLSHDVGTIANPRHVADENLLQTLCLLDKDDTALHVDASLVRRGRGRFENAG